MKKLSEIKKIGADKAVSTVKSVRRAQRAIKKKMFAYIAAGFGLVAGLAWNDAIKMIIDYFIPDNGETIIAKLIYAVSITVIVGLILFYVEKSTEEKS